MIGEPGTIDEIVADAAAAGYVATVRLIRDWTQVGLLDYPQRRPADRGHGSSPALYSANQRMLFLTLLYHRRGGSAKSISSLARVPVGIWMNWGDEHVPLRLARRAFRTWIGDPRVNLQRARETAREIVGQLDNPRANREARTHLLEIVTGINYTGKADLGALEDAIRAVFEPDSRLVRRALGHPAAPVVTESVIAVTKARLAAVDAVLGGVVSDSAFAQARDAHFYAYAEYAARQPFLVASGASFYEPVTAGNTLNNCCRHLLTAIGMEIIFPEDAERLRVQRASSPRPTASAVGLVPASPEGG